jgi:hypothetical protein
MPYEQAVASAQLIRDCIEELGITRKEFADYIVGYSYDTVRGLVTRRSCSQEFIDACRMTAGEMKDEVLATGFAELARKLQEHRDEESAKLDPWQGAQRKVRRPRPRRGDASTIARTWSAIWQTSRDRREAVWLETVEITASNRNRKGLFDISNWGDGRWLEPQWAVGEDEPEHFRWEGGGGFFHSWIGGHFASAPEGPVASGVFHLNLENFRGAMAGVWSGVSPDSENTHALLIFGRDEESAMSRFEAERENNPDLPYIPPDDTKGKGVN